MKNGHENVDRERAGEATLESWKEIAGYLQRQVRTVRRWEKEEGLPVHRHVHKSRGSVYAYPGEIDAWRVSRRVVPETPPPARALWKIPAFALTIVLCLMMVGNGIRPVSAQQPSAEKAARQVWVTHPGEQPASISPDGRIATFIDWATGGDLCVRDLAIGLDRRLTTGGWPESPVFSPDGRQIAYYWNLPRSGELRVIPAAGGNPRTIRRQWTDGYVLPQDWSPDGKQLLVVHVLPDRTSQLALISVDKGSIRPLKSFGWEDLNAKFSPDGRLIAYDSPAGPKTPARDIFVLAVDGSREAAAVQNPANDANPAWSPDGSHIFFFSDRTGQRSLWSVPFENGKPGPAELVKADLGGVPNMWMTRTGILDYAISGTSNPNIYSADLGADGKPAKPPMLAIDKFLNANSGPSLSPSGKYLVYVSRGRGLVFRTLKTGEERIVPTQVPVNLAINVGLMWFPDERSILAVSNVPQGPGLNFYRINLDTGSAKLLVRTPLHPGGAALSPDGKSFFYQSDVQNQRARLVKFDLESHRETELKVIDGARLRGVVVSPDGKWIAYSALEDGASVSSDTGSYIAVIPAGGSPARELFRGSLWGGTARWILAWTPDQRYVIFAREGRTGSPAALWRVPVAGGAAEPILSMPGAITFPQIHPDGRRMYFSATTNRPDELWALENFLPRTAAKR